jgi:glycosyltransferase involved in cell wall biosynthesis
VISKSQFTERRILDVITPTLNADKYLDFCLLSTKQLRETIVSHILVDSGSKDRTLDVANWHEVKSIYYPPGNMYAAINGGITESDSEWVTYLNGDDFIYPKSLMLALESMGDDYDVIYANIDYIDDEGRFVHHWKSAETSNFAGLFASNIMPFPQQGTLFRRSLWEKLGGFREQFRYSADFDFFLRAFASGARFGYFCGAPTAAFRLHGDQISHNFISAMQSEVRESVADAQLLATPHEMIFAKFNMRVRNLSSYIVRFLRFAHLYRRFRFIRSIQ